MLLFILIYHTILLRTMSNNTSANANAANYMATNPVMHERTKHIELDYHFVWDKVAHDHLRSNFINTLPCDKLSLSDIISRLKNTSYQPTNVYGYDNWTWKMTLFPANISNQPSPLNAEQRLLYLYLNLQDVVCDLWSYNYWPKNQTKNPNPL